MAMYLDIPNIQGESLSPNPNWNQKIEIYSLGYSVSHHASPQQGGGLVSSGAEFHPLQFTKTMDKATAPMFAKLAGGEPILSATIRVSRAGASGSGPQGGLFEAETYTFQNVLFMSYDTSGEPGPGGLPSEQWSFAFTSVVEKFQTVDPTGNLQPPQTFGFSVSSASAIKV